MIQNYVTMQAFVRMEEHVLSTTTVPKSANVPQDIQDINVNKNNPPLHVQTIARIMENAPLVTTSYRTLRQCVNVCRDIAETYVRTLSVMTRSVPTEEVV